MDTGHGPRKECTPGPVESYMLATSDTCITKHIAGEPNLGINAMHKYDVA